MPYKILISYYAATALFLSLDYGFGVNVRVAFLESAPGFKVFYYLVCFACLAVMLRWPASSEIVGAVESLATLVALIVNMALRSMIINDEVLETGVGFVTMSEIINFLIAGSAAYASYMRGLRSIASRSGFD